MSKEKDKEIASLEDLLGDPSEREAYRFIPSINKSVKIRRLTLGDLAKIAAFNRSKGWEDDPYRTTIGIVQRGLVEPKVSYSQTESMPVNTATEIVNAISEFSGLTEEAMEQARNLSEETTEST